MEEMPSLRQGGHPKTRRSRMSERAIQRTDLILLAMNQATPAIERCGMKTLSWKPDQNSPAGCVIKQEGARRVSMGPSCEDMTGHGRAKGEACSPALRSECDPSRAPQVLLCPLPDSVEIKHLTLAVVMCAFALAHASEVWANADHATLKKGPAERLYNLVVEVATEERMRVRDHTISLGRRVGLARDLGKVDGDLNEPRGAGDQLPLSLGVQGACGLSADGSSMSLATGLPSIRCD